MKTQVKLIIANTQSETVYFNYGDDYSDITRIIVEDHSPWEEIDKDELYTLEDFVMHYNRNNNKTNSFAFILKKEQQITAQSAIQCILKKKEEAIQKAKAEEKARKEAAEKKKAEAHLKKLAKTQEQKRLLFEQLKKELNQ